MKKRPKRWSAIRAYRKILQQRGPRSRAERAFWRSRLLGNVLTANLASRLVAMWQQAIAAPKAAASEKYQEALNAAIEPYRGKGLLLAVSHDDKSPEILAVGADAPKVFTTAEATGRRYVLMGSPPASDALPTILPFCNG